MSSIKDLIIDFGEISPDNEEAKIKFLESNAVLIFNTPITPSNLVEMFIIILTKGSYSLKTGNISRASTELSYLESILNPDYIQKLDEKDSNLITNLYFELGIINLKQKKLLKAEKYIKKTIEKSSQKQNYLKLYSTIYHKTATFLFYILVTLTVTRHLLKWLMENKTLIHGALLIGSIICLLLIFIVYILKEVKTKHLKRKFNLD